MAELSIHEIYRRLAESGSLWFETSRCDESNGDSLFFSAPVEVIRLMARDDPEEFFSRLELRRREGYSLAGWMSYEAGYLFEPALQELASMLSDSEQLAWFGVYEKPERIAFGELAGLDGESFASASFSISDVAFEFTREEYIEKIDLLRREIGAGNVYQVNFTGRYRFGFQGSAAGLFHAMKMRQPSAYTAMLNTGGKIVLSFSPELFFRRNGLSIETMPMKGPRPGVKAKRRIS